MKRARTITAVAVVSIAIGWFVTAEVVQSATLKENVERLSDADPAVREAAIDALAKQGREALGAYRSILTTSESPLQQAGLAEAIRRFGLHDDEIRLFTPELTARRASTRRVAIWLIGATKPSLVTDSLRGIVGDANELLELRADAATALGRVGSAQRDFLWGVASNPTSEIELRGAVLRGLALTGTTGVEDVLSIATDEKSPAALVAAAWAAVVDPGADAESKLVDLLSDSSAPVRAAAAGALAIRQASSDAAVEALGERLTDEEEPTARLAALMAACATGRADELQDAVAGLLDDSDPTVEAQAIWSTAHRSKDTRRDTLQKLQTKLTSQSFWIRYQAALALMEAGDGSGAPAMLADSSDPDEVISATAGAAVTKIKAKLTAAKK